MKKPLIAIVIAFAIGTSARSQSLPPRRTPVDVVRDYWQQEIEGEMFTDAGWRRSRTLLLRQDDPRPAGYSVVHVISDSSDTEELSPERTEHGSQVGVGFVERGTIDPNLRFTPAPTHGASGVLFGPSGVQFFVLLVDHHWERDPEGKSIEIPHAPEWRIAQANCGMYLSVESAIEYVNREQQDAKAAGRANAANTIRILKQWSRGKPGVKKPSQSEPREPNSVRK
jgi:hypothetical protein